MLKKKKKKKLDQNLQWENKNVVKQGWPQGVTTKARTEDGEAKEDED